MIEIQRIGESDIWLERLEGGVFESVDFHRAVFNGHCFRGAIFRDVSLRGIFAMETDFTGVRFERCNFFCSNLTRADFTDAVLDDCCLIGVLMNGVNLRGAKLSNSDFRGTKSGADPDTPILAELAGAIYDDRTEWPEDFDPKPFGAFDGTTSPWRRAAE